MSSATRVLPTLDGSLLLSDFVDFNLEHNATLPAYIYSNGTNSVTEISFLESCRAAHRVAHAVRPNHEGSDGQVVALIANTDNLLYNALTTGLVRAGLVPFPISPRNSPEAVLSMLYKTSCHRLLVTKSSLAPLLTGIKAAIRDDFSLSIEEIPTLAQIFPRLGQETATEAFVPYYKQTLRAADDIILYLHSSGSTGFPKPIPQSNKLIVHFCALTLMRDLGTLGLRLSAMHLPPFHTFGVYMQLLHPLTSLLPVCLYPPTSFNDPTEAPVVPNSDNIIEHSKRTGADGLVIVPSFLEIWNSEPESLDWLKSLKLVSFAGGPLSWVVGNALAEAGIPLRPFYGGTEFGAGTTLIASADEQELRRPEDWNYMCFSDKLDVRWVAQGDGTFECQFLTSPIYQPAVENLADVKGYATGDSWEPHPTKKGFWKIVGRVDDVIILSSGEKTVPAPIEGVILSSPLISGAVIFGRERNQVGVLLEPREGVEVGSLAEFRNHIWPIIEAANATSPSFSRIFKEMILLTTAEKPLPRAAKGTVNKKAAVKIYDNEIRDLYETVDASKKASDNVEPPKSWGKKHILAWLLEHTADIHSGKPIDIETDLFDQGFDSLSATYLRNRIIGALASSADPKAKAAATGVTQNIIFSYPTVIKLATHISNLLVHDGATELVHALSAKEGIEDMIKKYSVGLDRSVAVENSVSSRGDKVHVILLTGSTGGLGSYLLEKLLKDIAVERIYAYNRPAKGTSIGERQKEAFEDKGLDTSLLASDKLVFVEGDSALKNIGLAKALYDEIRNSTTLIIHNAWRLDFNLSLASFEPNIRGTRNLIDLAHSSPNSSTLRFMFTSSIASSQGWQEASPFPEEVQMDATFAVGGGYGEGKYVSERLLAASGLQASSFRIGQICGGLPNGSWATSDWLPSVIKSSLALGALPDAQGRISWIPTHVVAQTVLDVAFGTGKPSLALNIVHPRPVEWHSIMQPLSQALSDKQVTLEPLPLVPFSEWFSRLEERSETATAEDFQHMPAMKILHFFRGMASADQAIRDLGRMDVESVGLSDLSTTKCQSASKTMQSVPQIDSEDASRWVAYWKGKHFLE